MAQMAEEREIEMWELIYEDTFGFGEDRDPVKSECAGENDRDGFIMLWNSVLNESIAGTAEKPVSGFARFTLVIKTPAGSASYISIDADRYLKQLSLLKHIACNDAINETACRHYEFFLKEKEKQFWKLLKAGF